jgi:hypothetical protein
VFGENFPLLSFESQRDVGRRKGLTCPLHRDGAIDCLSSILISVALQFQLIKCAREMKRAILQRLT